MSLKSISYLELWWPFLCYFSRGHYEEQFYEFISNLCQWLRCLKDFLSGALAASVLSGEEPFMQF